MGMDSRMISAIERLSVIEAGQLLHDGTSEMCGAFPVIITMEVARRHGANLGVLYNYANSGDSLDGKEHVVGYASMGLYKSPLSEQEKQELLAVAKKVITGYVMNGKEPEIAVNNPKFKTDGAVFVTIRKKNALRGCIGDVQAHRPLYQSVIKNAIAACSADPRFPPMTEKELKDIDIEISILSPMNPVKDIKDIQVGKHGLVIRKGSQSGLLLPQVATEQGWNRETFLKNICAKAGLPENAWRDAELYTFSAEVIR
jgi:hypothetical protein